MALFESYERRIEKINSVLSQYGISSVEECRELLGLQAAEGSPVASPRTPEYYKKRPCPELCRMAADILAEYIAAHPITNRNPSEKRN